MSLRISLFPAFVLCVLTSSCGNKSAPSAEKEAPSIQSALPVQSASPSASAASLEKAPVPPAKKPIPTLVPQLFEPAKGFDFYGVDDALIVVSGLEVGRIVDDKIEWLGKIPETNRWLGGSQINRVLGSMADGIDVLYSSVNGRAAQPTLFPLTGSKGAAVTFSPGGGMGWFIGTGKLGKTTIVGGYDMYDSYVIKTIRGPGLVINPTLATKMDCTDEEVQQQTFLGKSKESTIALPFRGLAVTEKGTLVTVGNICERDSRPAAEVWDQPGKSRIIELSSMIGKVSFFARLIRGKGDELWMDTHPVLRYNEGKIEPLPKLERPFSKLFVSRSRKLHGLMKRTIYRLDDGQWTAIAQLPWPMSFSTMTMDEQDNIWVSAAGGAAKLVEKSGLDVEGDCKTPFVYLYEVSWKNDSKYTYPTTRKALSTFPQVSEITLMEYWEDQRVLGIAVKSKEQGEAVIAHVKANMKDEHPELICYEPKKPRIIDMKADAKPK